MDQGNGLVDRCWMHNGECMGGFQMGGFIGGWTDRQMTGWITNE